MSFIHKQPVNRILRGLVKPFSGVIPDKYLFAIDGTLKVKLTEGKKMLFSGNPTSPLTRTLFWHGIEGFEYSEYKIFIALAKVSGCFFDIGANIGYYSVVAKIFNPNITVHGFEPLKGAARYFRKNVELNHLTGITISEKALCDKTGVMRFYSHINPKFKDIEDQLFGDSSLRKNENDYVYRVEFDVETDTLDNYITQHLGPDQKIDLIKMDTEGTENLVLRGADQVLSTHRPLIMCEIIKDGIEKEMEVIIEKYDYHIFRITPEGLERTGNLNVASWKLDFFLVPKEKEERIKNLLKV